MQKSRLSELLAVPALILSLWVLALCMDNRAAYARDMNWWLLIGGCLLGIVSIQVMAGETRPILGIIDKVKTMISLMGFVMVGLGIQKFFPATWSWMVHLVL